MGLSVIVPVYNGEKYIKDCLESIINQTYRDLQIIVVNDGSTDNTEAIVREIADNDSRVQLINKENGGVSSARNLGLDFIKKDFLTFVDCDDTLELDMYEALMKYIVENDYDIVHCGYKKMYKNECIKVVNGTNDIYIQKKKEALECIIEGKLFVGSLWNKIYKVKLFEDIYFDETLKINEDILINYYLFKKSNLSMFVDIPKYNYWKRDISTCRSVDDIKKFKDSLKVSSLIYNDCKGTDLEALAIKRYYYSLVVLYRAYYYNKHINKDNKNYNIKQIRTEIKSLLKTGLIKDKRHILLGVLMCYVPNAYGIIYKIYDYIRIPNWDVQ